MAVKKTTAAPQVRTRVRAVAALVLPPLESLTYDEMDAIYVGTGVDVVAPDISTARRLAALEWWVRATAGEDVTYAGVAARGRLADVEVAARGKPAATSG